MLKKNNRMARFIWILGASFFFVEYIVRVSPGVMSTSLMEDFRINAYQLGSLSAFFYYAYIPMQIPVGTLVDRFSARWLLGSMALLCALSCLLFATTNTLALAEACRFLIGITGAFAFVGALKLASVWFSSEHFGFLAGTTQALGMLGASVGAGPLSLAIESFGWRGTLVALSLILLVLTIFMYIFIRDRPCSHPTSKNSYWTVLKGLKTILWHRSTWINGLFVALLYAPTAAFGELWGTDYLERVYNLSKSQSASIISLLFIGWAVGSPCFGFLSDRLKKRKVIVLSSAALSLCFISALLYLPIHSLSILMILAFCYGFSNVGVSLCYAIACELHPPEYSGSALGFTNMASIMGGALFQPLLGFILDKQWTGGYIHGVRWYSAGEFKQAMLILPITLAVCLFVGFFLKESYGRLGSKAVLTH